MNGRPILFQLHPPVLEAEGLVAALQARLAAVEERGGLQTYLRVEGERRLPISVEEDLYWIAWIAQEALNNVRKHAAAHNVTVHLQFTSATVCLTVSDDGIGFDSKTARAGSLGRGGLRSIAERTERLGGSLRYESSPNQGTQLKVEVTL